MKVSETRDSQSESNEAKEVGSLEVKVSDNRESQSKSNEANEVGSLQVKLSERKESESENGAALPVVSSEMEVPESRELESKKESDKNVYQDTTEGDTSETASMPPVVFSSSESEEQNMITVNIVDDNDNVVKFRRSIDSFKLPSVCVHVDEIPAILENMKRNKEKKETSETPQRKRGRPKKEVLGVESDEASPVKRPRGRPQKDKVDQSPKLVVKRPRGRPRKINVVRSQSPEYDDITTPKRKRRKVNYIESSSSEETSSDEEQVSEAKKRMKSLLKNQYSSKKGKSGKERKKYTLRDWEKPESDSENIHPHMSFIDENSDETLPSNQTPTGHCILCNNKHYENIEQRMVRHYYSKHYRRIVIVKGTTILECKCGEVVSRDNLVNRNSHHHCPICWRPQEKGKDISRHLITEHKYEEKDIEIQKSKKKKK